MTENRVNVMKEQHSGTPQQTDTVAEQEKINTTEFPTVVAVDEEYQETTIPRKASHERKKRGLFRSRKVKHEDVPLYTVADLQPVDPEPESEEEEEGVKVYGDDAMDDTREVSVSQKTLVLDDTPDEDSDNEQATQMLLDGF